MRIDFYRVSNVKDKWRHRLVTLFLLALVLALYYAMHAGWLGPRLKAFSFLYVAIMLLILGVRALLTETGFRRLRT
jgi:hypothetical protein